MKKKAMVSGLTAALVAATLGVASLPSAAGAGTPVTIAEIAAMAPADQAALLNPLRAAASALDAVGQSNFAVVYARVGLNPTHGTVDLWLTDQTQAPAFIAAAKAHDPSIDTSIIQVHPAQYTLAAARAARGRFVAQAHRFKIFGMGVNTDGSGVTAEVDDPNAAASEVGPSSTVPGDMAHPGNPGPAVKITFTKGAPAQDASWNDSKWHDRTPFIGGDVITPDGHHYCTSGIPAVRTSDGHPIMVTAEHCFLGGTYVYTAAGTTWAWGNGQTGNYVGQVTSWNNQYDAEGLDGANNNADESDQNTWVPMIHTNYSYDFDMVCQSGARSAYLGNSATCNIGVDNNEWWWTGDNGFSHYGVLAADVNGKGAQDGDSGGTIWAWYTTSGRELRGMESGIDRYTPGSWLFTQAPDILSSLGLKLNPVT